mgnify:CR=1 FL=1
MNILHGAIVAETENLHGSHIFLDVVSVGATINIMMAASMASGRTIIENAAREPHVVDVANFLNSMGANIKGAGTDVIRIKGVEKLHRTEYSIIPDQIERRNIMFAAAATVVMLPLRMLSRNIWKQLQPNWKKSAVRLKNLMMLYVYVQARDFTAHM